MDSVAVAGIDLPARELLPLNGTNGQHEVVSDGGGVILTNDMKSRTASALEADVTTVCQYESKERFVITKNVIVIGLAFMIHFTAFHGTSNLQSSVNSDKALGTTTLAVIYGSLILSNIFLPMTVIR